MRSTSKKSDQESFKYCLAILDKVQLLRAHPRPRVKVKKMEVADFIEAGEQEPRIFEVLPAAVHHYPQYFKGAVPKELMEIIRGKTKKRKFHGIPIKKCLFWIQYPKPEDYYKDW